MRKRGTFFPFLTLVFLFLSAQAFAYGPHEKGTCRGKFHAHARDVMEALQLTEDQKEELHALREELNKKAIIIWKELEQKHVKLKESVLEGGETSGESFKGIVNEIADLKGRMVKDRLENWIRFVGILDASQKEILANRLKELREKRPKRGMHLREYFPFP